MKRSVTDHPLEKRLLAYSAMAGVALGTGMSAQAQQLRAERPVNPEALRAISVIDVSPGSENAYQRASDPSVFYVDIDPDDVLDESTAAFDLTGDGNANFLFRQNLGTAAGGFEQANWYAFGDEVIGYTSAGGNYRYGSALASAATIGPTVTNFVNNRTGYYGSLYTDFFNYGAYGPWGGQDAYLGFRIDLGGGLFRYGWWRLEISSGGGTFTIKELAYETTPNEAINSAEIPVELTGFDAVLNGGDVVLNWATASETVNAGFEVQMRATGRTDFQTLDFVEGAGTTTEAQAYSFRVADLMPGTYQFRLKQVDFDGAFEYSPEVEATVEVADTHLMSEAYPNPFARQTSFDLAVPEAQVVTAEVFNTVGQHVATLFDGALDANVTTKLALDATDLPSGLYVLRVTGETFQTTRKLTVSK